MQAYQRNNGALPPEIGNPPYLSMLDYGDNSVKSIPIEIESLLDLDSLSFDDGPIISLPAAFGNLTNLPTRPEIFILSLSTVAEV